MPIPVGPPKGWALFGPGPALLGPAREELSLECPERAPIAAALSGRDGALQPVQYKYNFNTNTNTNTNGLPMSDWFGALPPVIFAY